MKTTEAINALGALAQDTRLGIYRLLVQKGPRRSPGGRHCAEARCSRFVAFVSPAPVDEMRASSLRHGKAGSSSTPRTSSE